MTISIARIARNAAATIKTPRRAVVLGRRLVPLRAMTHDPEAYHMVSAWSSGQAMS